MNPKCECDECEAIRSIALQVAEARREALEAFIGILFQECQPNNGDLFSRVDDQIHALLKEPKP